MAAASPVWAQPVIAANGVVNATGYQAKLAPDTVFAVFGRGIGPAAIATASGPDYPESLGKHVGRHVGVIVGDAVARRSAEHLLALKAQERKRFPPLARALFAEGHVHAGVPVVVARDAPLEAERHEGRRIDDETARHDIRLSARRRRNDCG